LNALDLILRVDDPRYLVFAADRERDFVPPLNFVAVALLAIAAFRKPCGVAQRASMHSA
jgi:hypothetical protein